MAVFFNLNGVITLLLIAICTACYAKGYLPSFFEQNSQTSYKSTLWKLARLGERLSPWISISLILLGFKHFFM